MSSLKLTADSGGGTVELKAPATTASNGAKTWILPNDTGTANYVVGNSSTAGTLEFKPYYGPAFRAYQSSNQTIATSTEVTIVYNSETFDTDSCFNTTNYRFTPNLAGYYHVYSTLTWNPTNNVGSGWDAIQVLRKNGSEVSRHAIFLDAQDWLSSQLEDLVYLDGSSDYIDAYAWHNRGGDEGTVHTRTFISAHWVRP